MTKRRRRGGFKPFKAPTNPPPGTYDPSIDAQVRATQRGYGDLFQDYGIGKTRAQDDYLIGTGDITRSRDEALADLTRSRDRTFADLLASRTRGAEDYYSSLAALDRRYAGLGRSQLQSANASGVLGGGALGQALRKRQENQAIDRQPLDTNYTRFVDDSRQAESRLNEDFALGKSRTTDEAQRQGDRLSLALERAYGVQGDQTIALARAGRENTQLGIDASEARWAQAAGTGYVPPSRPSSEHRDPRTGQVFRLVRTPRGTLMRLLPSGQLVRRPRYSLRTR